MNGFMQHAGFSFIGACITSITGSATALADVLVTGTPTNTTCKEALHHPHLLACGQEDDGFGSEVALDEAPQHIHLLAQTDHHVGLGELQGGGHGGLTVH
jgi:hypothetical protein